MFRPESLQAKHQFLKRQRDLRGSQSIFLSFLDPNGYNFASMPAVTSFFSMWRSMICTRNFRRSEYCHEVHGSSAKLSTGERNIRAAKVRESADISDDASR